MERNKILNLAYGSNLNLGQMAYRCPTAKVYGKGMLLDYQLLFKGREDNAYATIEPKRGSKGIGVGVGAAAGG
ncbi:MAG: gamma-glutamylcyclotransferase family protein [Candidatus Syntrophopropionicum ammoniitolerans]